MNAQHSGIIRRKMVGIVLASACIVLAGCTPGSAAPSAEGKGALAQPAANEDGATLVKRADALAATGKFSPAAALYSKAAQAFNTAGDFTQSAKASEKAAGVLERLAAQLTAKAQTTGAAPKTPTAPLPVQAAIPPTPRPVRLPPLTPRPNWVIGRAVYADGRPIANFQVQIGKLYGNSKAQGTNGRYAFQVADPSLQILSLTAWGSINYRGQVYLLHLYPADGISADYYRKDVKKGVVRDFILKLSGNVPQPPGQPPLDPLDGKREDVFMNTGFYGFKMQLGNGSVGQHPVFKDHSTYDVTLAPNGPLADGSAGQVIHRTIKDVAQVWGGINVYDIPLGVYTVSVRVTGPDGVAHGLKLRKYPERGVVDPGGPFTLDSVTVTAPPPMTLESLGFATQGVFVQMLGG